MTRRFKILFVISIIMIITGGCAFLEGLRRDVGGTMQTAGQLIADNPPPSGPIEKQKLEEWLKWLAIFLVGNGTGGTVTSFVQGRKAKKIADAEG